MEYANISADMLEDIDREGRAVIHTDDNSLLWFDKGKSIILASVPGESVLWKTKKGKFVNEYCDYRISRYGKTYMGSEYFLLSVEKAVKYCINHNLPIPEDLSDEALSLEV